MNKEFAFPFYAKLTFLLVGLYVFVAILSVLQAIIVPLIFATMIAIVLNPVANALIRIKVNRIIAIVLAITLAFITISAILLLLFSQINRFSDSWPDLVDKSTAMLNQTITWFSGYFDVNAQNIHAWILKTKNEFLKSSNAIIGATLLGIGNVIIVLLLVPVYIFLLLFYKPLLLEFIYKLFGSKHENKVSEISHQTESVIQHYLIGLLIEASIIATLQSIGLLILGIDFALMLGIMGAMLNLIPYIGGIIAVVLPMLVALTTKSSGMYALYVLGIYYCIQLLDNNFIVPMIVASKVKINALFSILVVICGNALWGIPGMFLSLPLLGIVKLIFDHIEPLKPWGFLMGDSFPQRK